MKRSMKTIFFLTLVAAITVWVASPAVSKDKPADNMKILRDKIKADKKALVATNMDLTETEANGFWPVYNEYQKDLASINKRVAKLIESYAADYQAKSFTDERPRSSSMSLLPSNRRRAGSRHPMCPN